MTTHVLSVYDRLRPHLSAEDVLSRVGVEIVKRLGSEAYCNPLCHQSTSGESLQVNLHTGRWVCRSCQQAGVFGDLIQLVEYVQTGGRAPSHGSQQGDSATHREALRWLCEQYAVPYSEARDVDPALAIVHLFAMAAHEHLLKAPEVLAWIQDKWGFDLATVQSYGIGFMPSPILPSISVEANRPESRSAFRSSGVGFYPQDGGGFVTRFEGRVTFPYLEHGQAVYLIGRATPWTPEQAEKGRRPAKYHKLTVHSEVHPQVSPKITNDHLWNEPVMDGTSTVMVAEGIADGIAFSALGVPVVSPVTISFNEVDLERFLRKCKEREIKRVEILFDNELSGSGNFGAVRAARKIAEGGLSAAVLTLPLGPTQVAARDEVFNAIGADAFAELEQADPRRRKEIIEERLPDEAIRKWVMSQVEASKIDGAEWCAMEGAGAAEKLVEIRRAGVDVVWIEIAAAAELVDAGAPAQERVAVFSDAIALAAHIDDRISRGEYAGWIAKAAGKGVTKADVAERVVAARRQVKADRKEAEDVDSAVDVAGAQAAPLLVLLPPDHQAAAPAAPDAAAQPQPGVPLPPSALLAQKSEHDRYAPVRESVMRAVEAKASEEAIGKHVAQTIAVSMGFTPFKTPEQLVLVRGNERVDVGTGRSNSAFLRLLYLASGLTNSKSSNRGYIDAVMYFLERESTKANDVSWSYYDEKTGTVFFPMGDAAGSILQIATGAIYRTRMAEARVPAVAGQTFRPIEHVEKCAGAIDATFDTLRWVSLSPADRMMLVYWIVCLPILRKVGEIPIVRIEGGSSSGKTRAVSAVSYLVNGSQRGTVPTAAAMTSKLSTEMLTIDDNREKSGVNDEMRSTLLQATSQGAREKRKINSDTGTVTERVCGALLMNGIEPIHNGQSELASRMLLLRCDGRWRTADSPHEEALLYASILKLRHAFWSEATYRCAAALDLDQRWGDALGAEIEAIFGVTRIGRLSVYLRLMYLAWVVGQPAAGQQSCLDRVAASWVDAFALTGKSVLQSLIHEELAVSAMRYVFAYGRRSMKFSNGVGFAFDSAYQENPATGECTLGPLSSSKLSRLAREAANEMNAPKGLRHDLAAGQLLARVEDGLGFLREAGFGVTITSAEQGASQVMVYRAPWAASAGVPRPAGDTWTSDDAVTAQLRS